MNQPLMGLMQDDFPLNLHHIRRRMRDVHPDAEVVTLTAPGTVERATFGEVFERVDRLARVLGKLGVEPGDRVGTFAWNNQRHFELYFAVPCIGAVLHTLNIRLFEEQLTYIVNHAEDRVIFVDDSLVPLLEKLAPSFERVEHYVMMGSPSVMGSPRPGISAGCRTRCATRSCSRKPTRIPRTRSITPRSTSARRPRSVTRAARPATRRACSIRTVRSACTPPARCSRTRTALGHSDRVLAVVPMFHVNAWGLPYGTALAGADLILPDRFLQAEPLAKLIAAERPTLMGCVPTIFADLLRYADEHPDLDLSSLSNAACGGSAVPRQLMKDFEERHGVRIFQAWGMTETSPVATYSRPVVDDRDASAHPHDDDAYWDERAKQGRPLPWVELRLVDDGGDEVPRDGESTGEIQVRGPWVAARYFDDDSEEGKFASGWLRTGDIASVDGKGSVQITDRSKDVIKSGGEWISSVELENEVMAHPDVVEAAVIAKPDERWAERPLCCVVLREGATARARRISSSTCAGAWPSGGCRTSSRSSERFRRRASASSTRRCCGGGWQRGRSKGACVSDDRCW